MAFLDRTVRVLGAVITAFKFSASDEVIYRHIKVIGHGYKHRNVGASLAVFVI